MDTPITLNLQQWQASGQYYHFDGNLTGHDIFYRIQGQGEALLLIHGFPSCSWDWYKICDQLSQHYQVISFDLLGFGYSDKPQQHHYTIFEQADIAEALLRELNIDRCRILAHDYGDTVFQELLARQIEGSLSVNMLSAAMLNGGIFHGVHKPLLAQKLLISPLGGIASRLMSQTTFNHSFKKIFGKDTQPSKTELDQLWQANSYNNGLRNAHLLIRYMDERKQYAKRWGGALLNSPIPLRLIDGEVDPISGGHLSDYYEANMPEPDSVRLKGIGHYPQLEAPELVLQYYFEFVDNLKNKL